MCGIVGYIGMRDAREIIPLALQAIEYRGYEAAGIVLLTVDGTPYIRKALKREVGVGASGALAALDVPHGLSFPVGVGHTRWPTHGANTLANAHPHHDCTETIWVAHNGIVDNFHDLERALKDHRRASETDTELIAHLIEEEYGTDTPLDVAVRRALARVSGTYALAIVSRREPDKIVCARMGSPLWIGKGTDGMFVSSDRAGFARWADEAFALEDGDVGVVTASGYHGPARPEERVVWDVQTAQKDGHPHFMLKEILEQCDTVRNALNRGGRLSGDDAILGGLQDHADAFMRITTIHLLACGTAYHAALIGARILAHFTDLSDVHAWQASEVGEQEDRVFVVPGRTAAIAISQSGETYDTIRALKFCKEKGALAVGVVNRVGSEIDRITDCGVHCNAGPEISVASTKAFVSQLTALALIALRLGRHKGYVLRSQGAELVQAFRALPDNVERVLAMREEIRAIAETFADYGRYLFIGRGLHFPVALEGALKLKEITYRTAEGYAAGEMKHGPLALLDETFPTVALVPQDTTFDAMIANIMEARRTGSPCIAVTTSGAEDHVRSIARAVIAVPKTHPVLQPILSVIPLQLFAYYLACALGRDVDQPRNLAKSVTVG